MIAWNDANSFIPVLIPVDTIMPRCSAPLFYPTTLITNVHLDASSNADDIEVLTKLSNMPKKAGKMLLSPCRHCQLSNDQFRSIRDNCETCPLLWQSGRGESVSSPWQPLTDRVMQFYPLPICHPTTYLCPQALRFRNLYLTYNAFT